LSPLELAKLRPGII
jgi:hypothetical protein